IPDQRDRFTGCVLGGKLAEQQVAVTVDDRQQVVEIMGNPAGKATHRFHLLRLLELSFEPIAGGNVADNTCKASLAVQLKLGDSQLRREETAVAPESFRL